MGGTELVEVLELPDVDGDKEEDPEVSMFVCPCGKRMPAAAAAAAEAIAVEIPSAPPPAPAPDWVWRPSGLLWFISGAMGPALPGIGVVPAGDTYVGTELLGALFPAGAPLKL